METGFIDKFPFGAAFGKGLTLRGGQTHMIRYLQPLLERVEKGDIDPSFLITHRLALDEVPEMYKTFVNKEDHCVKVAPGLSRRPRTPRDPAANAAGWRYLAPSV